MAGGPGVLLIRPAAPAEHEAAGELVLDAYRTLGEEPSEAYGAALRDAADRARTGEVLVALLDDRLAGCVTFVDARAELSQFADADAASIRMLGVDASARGAGVGEALVRACLDRAAALGRPRVRLHTQRNMHAAQRLYERLGFARDPETDWSPKPGVTLLGYVRATSRASSPASAPTGSRPGAP